MFCKAIGGQVSHCHLPIVQVVNHKRSGKCCEAGCISASSSTKTASKSSCSCPYVGMQSAVISITDCVGALANFAVHALQGCASIDAAYTSPPSQAASSASADVCTL